MYKIALIKPCNITIENGLMDNDKIVSHIELINVTHQTMMETIVDKINLQHDGIADTIICYENANNIYQLCYLDPKPNNQEESEESFNSIASYLSFKDIYGPSILINSKILENGICGTDTLDINTIKELLDSKINHKGVKLLCNGSVVEFTFKGSSPLQAEELDQYLVMEHNLLKFNFIIYLKKNPSETINKNATKLLGTGKIADDVIVVLKITESEYIDLTTEIMEKLLTICCDTLSKRKLTEQENENEKINDLPVVKNAHCILKKKYNDYKVKCQNCNNSPNTFRICSGCFRIKYCNKKCQKEHWIYHKENCLYMQEPINKNI